MALQITSSKRKSIPAVDEKVWARPAEAVVSKNFPNHFCRFYRLCRTTKVIIIDFLLYTTRASSLWCRWKIKIKNYSTSFYLQTWTLPFREIRLNTYRVSPIPVTCLASVALFRSCLWTVTTSENLDSVYTTIIIVIIDGCLYLRAIRSVVWYYIDL